VFIYQLCIQYAENVDEWNQVRSGVVNGRRITSGAWSFYLQEPCQVRLAEIPRSILPHKKVFARRPYPLCNRCGIRNTVQSIVCPYCCIAVVIRSIRLLYNATVFSAQDSGYTRICLLAMLPAESRSFSYLEQNYI